MTKKIYIFLCATILALLGFNQLRPFGANGARQCPATDAAGKNANFVLETTSRCPQAVSEAGGTAARPTAEAATRWVEGSSRTPIGDASPVETSMQQPFSMQADIIDTANFPAAFFQGETDEVLVTANATEGVFPAGTEMRVNPVAAQEAMDAAQRQCDDETSVVDAVAADIAFWCNGREVQPNGHVEVRLMAKRIVGGDDHEAVTVSNNGIAEVVGAANAGMSAFSTDHFTVYGIVGKTYQDTKVKKSARQIYRFYLNNTLINTQIVKNGDELMEPATPAGYTKVVFKGWYIQDSTSALTFGPVSIPETQTKNDTFLVEARYDTLYKVVFYTDSSATVIHEVKLGSNGDKVGTDDVTLMDSVSKVFDMWGDMLTDTTLVSDDTVVVESADIDLVPSFVDGVYVYFESLGGTAVKAQHIAKDTTAARPTPPTRAGYTFKGWHTSYDLATQTCGTDTFAFAGKVTKDTTLYAKWEPKQNRYKLRIWQENADDEEYTLFDSLYLTGNVGQEVPFDSLLNTILPKDKYDGFHLNGTALPTWFNSISKFQEQFDYHAPYAIYDEHGEWTGLDYNSYLFYINDQRDTIYEMVKECRNYYYYLDENGDSVECELISPNGNIHHYYIYNADNVPTDTVIWVYNEDQSDDVDFYVYVSENGDKDTIRNLKYDYKCFNTDDTLKTYSYFDAFAYIDNRAAFSIGPDTSNSIGWTAVDTTNNRISKSTQPGKFSGDLSVHADGSTVVNVFYSRDTYRFLFRFGDSREKDEDGNIIYESAVTNNSRNDDNTSMADYKRTRNNRYGRKIGEYHINPQHAENSDSLLDGATYRYTDLFNTAMSVKHGENLYRAINGLNSKRISPTDQPETTKNKVTYFIDDKDWAWYATWKETDELDPYNLTPRNSMVEINPTVDNQVLFDGNYLKNDDGTPVYPHGSEVQMVLRRIDDPDATQWVRNQFLHSYTHYYEPLPGNIQGEMSHLYCELTKINNQQFSRKLNGKSYNFLDRYDKLVWGNYWYGETAWLNVPEKGFTIISVDNYKNGNPPLRLYPEESVSVDASEPQLWKYFSKDFEWKSGNDWPYNAPSYNWSPNLLVSGDEKISPPVKFYHIRNQYPVRFIDGGVTVLDTNLYYEQYLNLSEENVPDLAEYPDSLHVVAFNKIKGAEGITVKDGGRKLTKDCGNLTLRFEGWYADSAFETPASYPLIMPYDTLTYYAKWVPDSCKVTFDFENIQQGDTTVTVACGEPFPTTALNDINNSRIPKHRHSFVRWMDRNGIAFNEKGLILHDTLFHALWYEDSTYRVVYHAGDRGTFAITDDPCRYLPGVKAATLGMAIPNNTTDTVFAGWRIGNGPITLTQGLFDINETNDNADTRKDSVIHLFAMYEPVERTTTNITYHSNYPDGKSSAKDINIGTVQDADTTFADKIVNDDFLIKEDAASLGWSINGYEFVGWSDTELPKSLNGNTGSDSRNFFFKNETVALEKADNVLYAVWTPKTELIIQKVWDDADNQDGKRKPVTIIVKADGDSIDQVTFSDISAPAQQAVLSVNKFNVLGEITYSVEEKEVPDGYAASYIVLPCTNNDDPDPEPDQGPEPDPDPDLSSLSSSPKSMTDPGAGPANNCPIVATVTNTHAPTKREITVAKVWNDAFNQDGKRPNSVRVTLYANNEATDSVTVLNEGNAWRHTFENLYVFANGDSIQYSVVEDAVAEYTTAYSGNMENGFTVTNTHEPKMVEITATKVWADQDARSRKQTPVTFYRTQFADTEFDPANVTAAWTAVKDTFFTTSDTNSVTLSVPAYLNGDTIYYAFAETSVPNGYHANPTGMPLSPNDTVRNIANDPVTVAIVPVLKKLTGREWQSNDQYEIRLDPQYATQPMPDGILSENIEGNAYVYCPLIVNKDSVNVADTARLVHFKPITFRISDLDGKSDTTFHYTLYEATALQSGLERPMGITYGPERYNVAIRVEAGEEAMSATVTCTPEGSTQPVDTASFLNRYDAEATTYRMMAEKILSTYNTTKTLENNAYTFVIKPVGTQAAKAPMPDGTSGSGTSRTFEAGNDGNSIIFPITIGHQTLNAAGYTDAELKDTVVFEYQVYEKIPAAAANQNNGLHLLKTMSATGDTLEHYYDATVHYRAIKVWLYESATGDTAIISVKGTSDIQLDDFYATANGNKALSADEYAARHHNGIPRFHNVIIGRTKVPVQKVWSDYNDFFGHRTAAVTAELKRNGNTIDSVLNLSAAIDWKDTFRNLPYATINPVDFTVSPYTYTVTEQTVPAHYDAAVTGNASNGYTITNTVKDVETDTTLAVRKVWGNGTPAGASVTIQLFDNGAALANPWTYTNAKGQSVTVDTRMTLSGNTWSGSFGPLPKFDIYFNAHSYSIKETALQTADGLDYLTKITGNASDGLTVTNTPVPTLDKQVNGSDFMRLNNLWNDTIPYTLRTSIPMTDGLTAFVVTDILESVFDTIGEPVITLNSVVLDNNNVYTYNTATRTMTFDFADYLTDNYQGKPVLITFRAKLNDNATKAALDAYLNTQTQEPAIPNSANFVMNANERIVTRPSDTVYVTPPYVEIKVTKVWDDNNNNDGYRPGSITVGLLPVSGDFSIPDVTLNEGNHWTGSFGKWPRYHEGELIEYIALEETVPEYETEVSYRAFEGDYEYTVTVTNVHTPDSVDLVLLKTWEDNHDAQGLRRPVTVQLYRARNDENPVFDPHGTPDPNVWTAVGDPQTLGTADRDTLRWRMPRFSNRVENVYAVREIDVPAGYEALYSHFGIMAEDDNYEDILADVVRVTNRHYIPTTVTLDVQKKIRGREWYGEDSFTFALVPRNGNPMPANSMVTNGVLHARTQIGSGSSAVSDSVKAGAFLPISFTMEHLGENAAPKTYTYTIRELTPNEAGTPRIAGLTYSQKRFSVDITLSVGDNDSLMAEVAYWATTTRGGVEQRDSLVSVPVIVNTYNESSFLYRAKAQKGLAQAGTRALRDGQFQFTLRPVGDNAAKAPMPMNTTGSGAGRVLTVSNTGNAVRFFENDADGIRFDYDELRNAGFSHEQLVEGISFVYQMQEVVPDNAVNHNDGTMSLHENGVTTYYDAVVHFRQFNLRDSVYTDDHGDSRNFLLLTPANDPAHREYFRKDDGDTVFLGRNEYASLLRHGDDPDNNGSVVPIFRNVSIADTAITVNKIWVDYNDALGLRPTQVQVALLADGVPVPDAVATLNEGNSWRHTFRNLPFAKINSALGTDTILYSVVETPVDSYEPLYSSTAYGRTVTNTLDSNIVKRDTNIVVNKTWIAPADATHPDITILLLQDGVKYDSVVLHHGATSHTFSGLPYYDVRQNGRVVVNNRELRPFVYSIAERPVPGYTSVVDNGAGSLTNTIAQEYLTVAGRKTWADPAGTVHPSITVVLERDGDSIARAVLANGRSEYAFRNLPRYDVPSGGVTIAEGDGHEFRYSVRELPVHGYSSAQDGYDFTNTILQDYTQFPVRKVWNDRDDQDGYRPQSVTLTLTGTTPAYSRSYSMELSGDGNVWDSAFKDLPVYDDARNVIAYSLSEPDVPAHYSSVVSGHTVTNSHVPDSVLVRVSKIWDDRNNNDRHRPAAITLHLTANGETLQSREVSGTGYEWEVSFGKWPRRKNGQDIQYSVAENAISHYEVAGVTRVHSDDETIFRLRITNSHRLDSISPRVAKIWTGDPGERTVVFRLYRTLLVNVPFDPHSEDWTLMESASTSTGQQSEIVAFGRYPKFHDGTAYRYYVHEASAVEGFEPVYAHNGEIRESNDFTETVTNVKVDPVQATVPVKKILLGRDWDDDDAFMMALVPQNGPAPDDAVNVDGISFGTATVTHDSDGHDSLRTANFPPITFTLEDLEGKHDSVFRYHVRELTATESGLHRLPGVSYSTELYLVDIHLSKANHTLRVNGISVHRSGDTEPVDTAVITNHFDNLTTHFVLKAEKGLSVSGLHRTLADGDFSFTLKPVGEHAAIAPMPSNASGSGKNRTLTVRNEGHMVLFDDPEDLGFVFSYDDLLNRLDFSEEQLVQGVSFEYEIAEDIPDGTVLNTDDFTRRRTVTDGNGIMVDEAYDAVVHTRIITVRKTSVNGVTLLKVTASGNDLNDDFCLDDNGDTVKVAFGSREHARRHGTGGVPVFRNTLSARTAVSVEKRWDDFHNALATRPAGVNVTLLANGIPTDSVHTLDEEGGWRHTFRNLPVADAGGVIEYSVREDEVRNYTADYSGGMDEGLVIRNTLTSYGDDEQCAVIVDRSQLSECTETPCPAFVTADGISYPVAKIDGYCWMTENLRTPTPGALAYSSTLSPDEQANAQNYGFLYTWREAAGGTDDPQRINGYVRGICPNGWHLPTVREINVLRTNSADALSAEGAWPGLTGNNASGFNALPAGYFNGSSQRFEGLHSITYFHGDSEETAFSIRYYCCTVIPEHEGVGNAYSVRCVKDCE